MSTPIYDELKSTFELMRSTAKIEARNELAAELRQLPKPTKQVIDIIKKLEVPNDKH